MSSTRAASAASSRRAKQKLVQLLFGPKHSGKGREAHKKLDHASFSFAELKAAFLQRVHDIHPDKHAHKKSGGLVESSTEVDDLSNEFVRLQEAWDDYEKMAKMMTRVGSGSSEANFTLFGVGCSFSDSPDEQRKRSEIMDQAGRGWLTAGILSERTTTSEDDDDTRSRLGSTKLIDDEMFVVESDNGDANAAAGESGHSDERPTARPKKALVDIPRHLQKRTGR